MEVEVRKVYMLKSIDESGETWTIRLCQKRNYDLVWHIMCQIKLRHTKFGAKIAIQYMERSKIMIGVFR